MLHVTITSEVAGFAERKVESGMIEQKTTSTVSGNFIEFWRGKLNNIDKYQFQYS